jgi:hypothetical protein
MMTRSRWPVGAVSALLVLAGIAGCSRSTTPAAGRLTVDGQAEVFRPGEARREVTGTRNLELGDRVRVRQGTAVIHLPDDRQLELRQGTDVELQDGGSGASVRPSLMGGDLLVVSGDKPLAVGAEGGEVAVHGDGRLSKGVALLVAVYKGTAQLSAGESTLTVPALRQTSLRATGQFPSKLTPLEYAPADGWDQRYLSDAIELTNQLNARSQGFSAQLGPSEGRSYTYFRDLFPRLAAEPGFTASLVNPSRPPGDTVVGAAITLEGTHGGFADRWAEVFAFRDLGAPWGLVALDQEVRQVPLLASVDGAIGRGPAQFAEGRPGGSPSSVLPPSGSPATTALVPRTTTTTPGRPTGSTTTTTAPASGPTTTVPPGPANTGSPLIDETVNSLVNTLTGLLRSLGQR